MSEKTGQKPTSPSRIGDLAEHYAITYLWDKGYHVFKNCGCTGPIDIIAIDPEGNVKLIDVKSYKDGRLSSRTTLQKELGVQYLHYNSKTRKLRFINHRINNE
jgi:Holliday junction resolvase